MILMAHKEDCDLIVNGITVLFQRLSSEAIEYTVAVPQSCTCGGIKVELIQGEPHSPGNFKAVIRFPDA